MTFATRKQATRPYEIAHRATPLSHSDAVRSRFDPNSSEVHRIAQMSNRQCELAPLTDFPEIHENSEDLSAEFRA
eukprot:3255529-Alexandrium_andersonii.AAC.1